MVGREVERPMSPAVLDRPTSFERTALALEAAGLNPYLLAAPGDIAETGYAHVGLSVTRDQFVLLSVEEVPVPSLDDGSQTRLDDLALALASKWGLVWRGAIEAGRVQVAFGSHVRFTGDDDPAETGLAVHDTLLAIHHAHETLRRRALHAAWTRPLA